MSHYRARLQTVTMYCHNQACKLMNDEQERRYREAGWDEPGYFEDEPECSVCGSELQEDEREVEACDGCGVESDDLRRDDAGVWCDECHQQQMVESLEAVGGERLMRAIAAHEREAREQRLERG